MISCFAGSRRAFLFSCRLDSENNEYTEKFKTSFMYLYAMYLYESVFFFFFFFFFFLCFLFFLFFSFFFFSFFLFVLLFLFLQKTYLKMQKVLVEIESYKTRRPLQQPPISW